MEKKANNYAYIAIVAIVAIVALVMLFSGNGEKSAKVVKLDSSVESANVGGQAINNNFLSKSNDYQINAPGCGSYDCSGCRNPTACAGCGNGGHWIGSPNNGECENLPSQE